TLVFSPDDRLVASTNRRTGAVAVFDTATGRLRQMLFNIGYATAMSFSPDSRTLAAATNWVAIDRPAGCCFGGSVWFSAITKGGRTGRVSMPYLPTGVAYVAHGKSFVTVGAGNLSIWMTRSGQRVGEDVRVPAAATSVEASADGRHVVVPLGSSTVLYDIAP